MIRKLTSLFRDREFIIYSFIGLSGVGLDFIVFLILVKLGVPAIIASIFSVSVGIINNFFLNRHFNFKRKDHTLRRLLSFYLIGLTGIILSVLFIAVLHDIFGLDSVVAKIISVPFIVLFQFWFNKNTSFAVDHRQVPWKEIITFTVCVTVVGLFIFNAPYFNFVDEADNLLGGQWLTHGGTLYVNYFSHHMPLPYFVAAPYFLLFGAKVIAVKVAFGITMAAWLLLMSRHLHKYYSIAFFSLFTLLVASTQIITWTHMLLAETFVAFAPPHAMILLITGSKRLTPMKDVFVFSILGAIPVLSSLSFAPISIVIYAIGLYALFFTDYSPKTLRLRIRQIFVAAFVFILPYLLFLAYMAATHSLSELHTQALDFNTHYYSQFSPDAPRNTVDGIARVAEGTATGLIYALTFSKVLTIPLLAFLATSATILSLVFLFRKKSYETAIAFALLFFFGASREGFGHLFGSGSNPRISITITLIWFLLVCLVIYEYKKQKARSQYDIVTYILLLVTLGYIALVSMQALAHATRDYATHNKTALASPSLEKEPTWIPNIINTVNKDDQYYVIEPFDFSNQLYVHSKPATKYRFIAPWHAACSKCVQDVISDIKTNKPNVIVYGTDGDVWGKKISEYSRPILQSFENDYYRIDTPALKDFFFRKDNEAAIDRALKEAGYINN